MKIRLLIGLLLVSSCSSGQPRIDPDVTKNINSMDCNELATTLVELEHAHTYGAEGVDLSLVGEISKRMAELNCFGPE